MKTFPFFTFYGASGTSPVGLSVSENTERVPLLAHARSYVFPPEFEPGLSRLF
jgi:hypothetical protein